MKITGEINLFVEDRKISGKEVRVFRTNISTKQHDETYIRGYMDVVLSSKTFPTEKTSKLDPNKVYTFDITDGWLNVRQYEKGGIVHKVFYIFANKGKLTKATPIDQEKRQKALEALEARKNVENASSDDLPF